jgi:hypothetical protein
LQIDCSTITLELGAVRITSRGAQILHQPANGGKNTGSYQGIASQLAEKVLVVLDFGWRDGLPLR